MRGRKRQRKKNLKKLGLWLDATQRQAFVTALKMQSVLTPIVRVIPMRAL